MIRGVQWQNNVVYSLPSSSRKRVLDARPRLFRLRSQQFSGRWRNRASLMNSEESIQTN